MQVQLHTSYERYVKQADACCYRTWGYLNKDKSNAIVYPTWYSGKHTDNDWLIGPGKGLDPAEYFIIVPNMLGNGLSSSPSNTPPPNNAANFPQVSKACLDQLALHVRLLKLAADL